MPQSEGWIWMNGEFLPAEEAKVHVMSHSLHYGSGVFEGVRAYATEYGPAIFRLADHTRRLFQSARILNMVIPFTPEVINEAQKACVKKNGFTSAYIRPLVYYNEASLGLHIQPHSQVCVAIATWPWGAYLGEEQAKTGVRLKTSSYSRHSGHAVLTKAKASGHYLNGTLASMEAKACGYDEALMLDPQGYISEASSANVFIIRDGVLITPPADNCLEGITRDTVCRLAQQEGLTVIQRRISRDEVYISDEGFLTGTAVELVGIRSVDDRPLGDGEVGPITLKLKRLYTDLVYAKAGVHPSWQTLV